VACRAAQVAQALLTFLFVCAAGSHSQVTGFISVGQTVSSANWHSTGVFFSAQASRGLDFGDAPLIGPLLPSPAPPNSDTRQADCDFPTSNKAASITSRIL
jgi:hypothetical protein